jgi:peptidoglycan hydrolase CwlO-like protein
MLKKLSSLALVLAVAFMFLAISGCGPKGAPQEMLDELDELKAATEACEAKLKTMDSSKTDMEREIETKTSKVATLTEERDALKAKLGIVK